MSTKNTAKKNVAAAPSMPRKDLPVTDPRRKLTREEWKQLSKEQKVARKAARQAARGPVKARITKLVLRYAARFDRLTKAFENEKPIQTSVMDINKQMRLIASEIDELPDTWLPAGRGPKHAFTVGMHVQLIESKVAHYEELLGEDIGEMEVVTAVRNRVVVKTVKGGVRLFLDARFLQPAV